VQLPHDGPEFCIRNGGVFEERKHGSLVRLYIFPMPHIGTVTLLVNNTNHTQVLIKLLNSSFLICKQIEFEILTSYLHGSAHISTMGRYKDIAAQRYNVVNGS